MKRPYKLRFELKPFLLSLLFGVLFFVVFFLLMERRNYGALETREDAFIWSGIFAIGFAFVSYLVWLVIKDYNAIVREECFQPGFDHELSQKMYLMRMRNGYAKGCLLVARCFGLLTLTNVIVYMSGSGFYESHRSWLIPLVITAIFVIAWANFRRLALKAASGITQDTSQSGK